MKITLISVDGCISLGIRHLSSKLKHAGHMVKLIFFPYMINKFYSNKILNNLKEICDDTDIIGISSMAYSSEKAAQIAIFLKDLNIPIIWGGVFPTVCPEHCLKYVDIICIGEGEEALSDLLNRVERKEYFKDTQNFFFKDNGKIIKNPVRPLIQDLDSLPFPDYDLNSQYTLENEKLVLMTERHFLRTNSRFGGFTVFNMRGCPYSCAYCINNAIKDIYPNQKIIRKNSIRYVIEEIKEIKRRFPSVERIRIDDDSFFVRSLEEIGLFTGLYKKEINLPFECNADPLMVNDEKIKLLADVGLRHIVMGIQTGSSRINEEIFMRPFSSEMSIKAAKIINKYHPGVEVTYDFITLNPFEKKKDILQTFDIIRELPKPFFLSINSMAFFPGSRIYDKAQEAGIKYKRLAFAQKGAWTRFGEIRKIDRFTDNKYLNFIIILMDGEVNSNRYGYLSKDLFYFLMNKRMIKLFNDKLKFVTYLFIIFLKLLIFLFVKLIPHKIKRLIVKLL